VGMTLLILGGASSGKSLFAERLLVSRRSGSGSPLIYAATGPSSGEGDPEWDERVRSHRARRDESGRWLTWELARAREPLWRFLLEQAGEAGVLVDSLGGWVSWVLAKVGQEDPGSATQLVVQETGKLAHALAQRPGPTVIVAEEVGLSVHPETRLGRVFQDCMGWCNQEISRIAEEAWLMVAGRPVRLGPWQESVQGRGGEAGHEKLEKGDRSSMGDLLDYQDLATGDIGNPGGPRC
jgi:adenosyl cobinamide kinase/adenosyl cobinamide phosphate guanylyltransferase